MTILEQAKIHYGIRHPMRPGISTPFSDGDEAIAAAVDKALAGMKAEIAAIYAKVNKNTPPAE